MTIPGRKVLASGTVGPESGMVTCVARVCIHIVNYNITSSIMLLLVTSTPVRPRSIKSFLPPFYPCTKPSAFFRATESDARAWEPSINLLLVIAALFL